MKRGAVVALILGAATVPSCARAPMRHSTATITIGPPRTSGGAQAVTERARDPVSTPPAVVDAPASTPDPWASAPALETIEGRVSYYHDSLAGHPTASGEPYDPAALTCASRDLPFGTLIRVVRADTGASVVVRVNDRGPWSRRHPRILDLSRAAAEALDMIRAGVVDVRAEIVRRGP